MPKRSSKHPGTQNISETAYRSYEQAVEETQPEESLPQATEEKQPETKNQAAVELGRLGGAKGGAARAKALSPERRKEIARKAAAKRWEKSKDAA